MIIIDYFSDVLCVWAYAGQIRLDELERSYGDRILVRQRFMDLFGDTGTRIGQGYEDGGFEGFNSHLKSLCEQWEHTHLYPGAWLDCRPCSSTTAHVFLKAAALCLGVQAEGCDRTRRDAHARLIHAVRTAFFEQGKDIARMDELHRLLPVAELGQADVDARIADGSAYAALHQDAEMARTLGVQGSPTYVFNEGRQLLFGNVGYRIVESNVRELLEAGEVQGTPSWC